MDELWEYDETPVDGRWYGETIPLSGRRMVSFYKDRRVRIWHRDSSQSVELDAVDAWELYEALGYYADDLRELAQTAYRSRKYEITRELLRVGVEPPDWLDAHLADSKKVQADQFDFLPSPQGLVPVLIWMDGQNNAVIQAMKECEDNG